MNPVIQKDILNVLANVVGILKIRETKDTTEIKKLSNHTIHNASVFQDEDSVTLAVLVYSLAKVLERAPPPAEYERLLNLLEKAKEFLYQGRELEYRDSVKNIFGMITGIDSRLRAYIHEVINEAQIKKGSRIYEHGISLARTAEIMNISQWELMGYIGKTGIAERVEDIRMVKSRMDFARSLFT